VGGQRDVSIGNYLHLEVPQLINRSHKYTTLILITRDYLTGVFFTFHLDNVTMTATAHLAATTEEDSIENLQSSIISLYLISLIIEGGKFSIEASSYDRG
jgi:hypothetical protein